ncbi:ATP-binding protein [Lentzea sp. BCCO 10_0061]|uniref:ATP-binding protein n=1 Tax=Lentzea sokolovensis TaxID=3095429 RepID=A0ABU4V771_9PSEU|nr:ATP-binding protein [Lentzea sp. BCCO 10_0061]MDX8147643.1 ATP-binding protein [Lentzea sp. BCCO 10_0061]
MGVLDGFRFHRVLSAPRPPDDPALPDPVPAQLFAALTGAHAELSGEADAAIAVAWCRLPDEGRLRFVVGGRPRFPPAGGETGPLLYPPGATGERTQLDVAEFPCWTSCSGQVDPLWTADDVGARGGFDDYVTHLRDPFAWLVVAEPLPASQVDGELLRLSTSIPRMRRRENSEADQVALERAQARYRELSRARTSGTWNVRLLVGGVSEIGVRRAAALLCGASELGELPYVLVPGSAIGSFESAAVPLAGDADGPRFPFTASSELLAAVARPPRKELPGIRLVEPATFDVTPERDGPIGLGVVLDESDQPAGSFGVDPATLNRHTFVTGATGGGKSQTARHLLEQLHHAHVPWLVIEPAKAEYAAMAGRIGGDQVVVIRPGDPDALPVGLNPLEPEPGFPIQTHIDLVRALFLAAFDADEPFPQVLSHALNRCYADLGWDTVLNESRLPGITPRYPTLSDLQRTALEVVDGIGYGKEITDNVRGFIDVRLGSLRLGTPGRFFEGGHPLDVAELLRRNVVLEIEDVGNDQDKAFFIGAVLIRLHQHLRTRRTPGPVELRHVTVIEEAHRLLRRTQEGSPAAHAIELFTALLAEIRAYGEGIVIAEQIPAKIVPDVVKNTALKIIHRLPALDDREVVGATMNLDEDQSRHVVSLPPGRAVVFVDGMDRPIRVTVPLGESREATAATAPPPVLRSRSVACGRSCTAKPCSLREIGLAARLAGSPRFVLWIELLTVAHLVGRPAPRPDAEWSRGLGEVDRRTLECAVAHGIQTSVDARYTGLADYYQPESLAKHLADVAMGTLDGITPCDGKEPMWQAGRFRWIDVLSALRTAESPGAHPDTPSWAARGLTLTGRTAKEQLAQLRAHPDMWRPARETITGNRAYEPAMARLSKEPVLRDRFLDATRFLNLTTTWPLHALTLPKES